MIDALYAETEMTQTAEGKEFQTRMRQLEALLQEVESIADPNVRTTTGQIIQELMEFYGAGLTSLVERLAQAGELGREMIDDLAQDELVGSLFLLYGLHPQDLETRVKAALEKVRPYLATHGGNVELLGVSEDGAVRLAMRGSCNGCASSSATMKNMIEQAIYDKAPEVTAIHVDGVAQPRSAGPAGFVPVEQLIGNIARNHMAQGAPL